MHPSFKFALALTAVLAAASTDPEVQAQSQSPHPFGQRPQPWQRRGDPILSATTTQQPWCKVVVYSPHVLHHRGKFHMWYLGTSSPTRTNTINLGYAESDDGLNWRPHPPNR